MQKWTRSATWVILAALGMCSGRVHAAQGQFAAVQGEVQWVRASGRTTAAVGERFDAGDRVRTGAGERAKLLVLDAAVLDVAPGSELVIDELSAVPEVERLAFAARLLRGRVLVRAAPAFARGTSHCTLETGTAVVSTPGGELVVHYDANGEFTEAAVLAGEAEVSGKVGAVAGGRVRLTAGQAVRVSKARLPQTPAQWGADRVRQYAEGIEVFGTGRRDGLNVLHPLTLGRLLEPTDVAAARHVDPWHGRPPGLSLPERMSADVYTNTQPIEVFRALPPGRPLTGDVRVDF